MCKQCVSYYDDFIKNLIIFSAVREMLLSNTTLFHPVLAAGTYGYIILLIFQRKTHIHVKIKNVKNISWEKYVQVRAFWCNGSYAPESRAPHCLLPRKNYGGYCIIT